VVDAGRWALLACLLPAAGRALPARDCCLLLSSWCLMPVCCVPRAACLPAARRRPRGAGAPVVRDAAGDDVEVRVRRQHLHRTAAQQVSNQWPRGGRHLPAIALQGQG
jgi:hypothetical protein